MTVAAVRIVGLRELLTPAAPVETSSEPVVAPAPEPDPAVVLEAMRQEVLARAEEAGFKAGMERAQAAIEASTAKLEKEAAEGRATETAAHRAAISRLETLVASLSKEVERQDLETAETALEIAWAVIERVLGEPTLTRDAIAPICQQALTEFQVRPVTLYVAAGDREGVRELIAQHEDVQLEVDTLLAAGTCRLQSRRGLYETGIATRLRAVTEAVVAQLEACR